jgi:Fe-S cluster biogenesis protein NfuA
MERKTILSQPTDLKERVGRLLIEEVGPLLQLDGAAMEVIDVANGVVRLRLGGVCSNCPSTLMAIIHGLEQELRARIPEVEYLEVVP